MDSKSSNSSTPPTTTSSPAPIITSPNIHLTHLPLILCLHGGGSSAQIFHFQMRRIESILKNRYRFIYPNGPLPSQPGHGILPVFESVKPYYRWVTDVWGKTPGKQEPPVEEVREVERVIGEAVEGVAGGGWEKVVGVVGFSQGGRLTQGVVCREYERRKVEKVTKEKLPAAGGADENPTPDYPATYHSHPEQLYKGFPSLSFGLTIGGPYPPISIHPSTSPPSSSQDSDPDSECDLTPLRSFPIIHAWGRSDHVKVGCQKLARLCDSPNTMIYEFDGEHHLPLTDWESAELVELMLEADGIELMI